MQKNKFTLLNELISKYNNSQKNKADEIFKSNIDSELKLYKVLEIALDGKKTVRVTFDDIVKKYGVENKEYLNEIDLVIENILVNLSAITKKNVEKEYENNISLQGNKQSPELIFLIEFVIKELF